MPGVPPSSSSRAKPRPTASRSAKGASKASTAAAREPVDNVTRVYHELRALIISGQLPPGSRVAERAVVARMGLSRTPVRSALHRLQQEGEKPVFRSGALTVDLIRRIVTVAGRPAKLTPREYDLLRLLVAHAGKVLTHSFILREIWSGDSDVQYLRIYIRQLRQKIEADPERPQHILTETGIGYRLRMD